jgi:starch phosphorylase
MSSHILRRPLPDALQGIAELALDLRWSWSEQNDRLWAMLDPEAWDRTKNPYLILQNVPHEQLLEAAGDTRLLEELRRWLDRRAKLLNTPGWFGERYAGGALTHVAYFSMEFGLSEALPIYSGGLGILAGDHLKTASDMGVPMVGIGLLYQQGYFRQVLAADGWQVEAFPYNDPTSLPVVPLLSDGGAWLRIKVPIPGRTLVLRVWQARVGRVPLYLLDSNDPLNSPWDRAITATLYADGQERRLLQELVLGVGGWRVLEALNLDVEVCHLNEGHAAFVVFARAVSFMRKMGCVFPVALWATRAGNVFTTHTSVTAAFDRFEPAVVRKYAQHLSEVSGVPVEDLMALGRQHPHDVNEAFNMAYLALRGSGAVNGVSRLHGRVSRSIFQPLFPNHPAAEVPVRHITNGVHVPSWDGPAAHDLWNRCAGEDYWLTVHDGPATPLDAVSDTELWAFRAAGRKTLVEYVRRRLARQAQQAGASPEEIERARWVLDPDALTLGLARRLTGYKRPTLLLHDAERLTRILCHPEHPVQLIIAGKAHPNDRIGKLMVQALAQFSARPDMRDRVIFLEDYDMALTQHLASGIDVWINTPRRPWEACGTSGMKMLVNGCLNLSELDGWWAEAYEPDFGWALGDAQEHTGPEWDSIEAAQLYDLLEREVVPAFYTRDADGVPGAWIRRVRASMARLTPVFSGQRMLRDYVERAYLPAATMYRRRSVYGAKLARELRTWQHDVAGAWHSLRFGDVRITPAGDRWHFEAQVFLGDLTPDMVRVEVYAEPLEDDAPFVAPLARKCPLAGTSNGHLFEGDVAATRPAAHYTARVVPYHQAAILPLEDPRILWHR